ncbi:DMT family transporter [Sporosarcina sp. 179-K 3D1 HS]|uniref:DMT family transporter n=1 Tax=Sporosarcina sp. 179-K 3D1 HS TaxID=3232169 RepID=UPI0039A0BE41
MAWLYVLFAAIIELFWVIGLRYSDSLLDWSLTIIAIVFSFYFIIKACEKLPSGTVYAVFTGSGAAAIFIIDVVVFQSAFSWVQAGCVGLIILGVVGLKMADPPIDEPEATAGGGS